MEEFGVNPETPASLTNATAGGDRPLEPAPANENPGLLTSLHDLLFGREILSDLDGKPTANQTTDWMHSSRRFAEGRRTAP